MANEMLIEYINEQVNYRGWSYAELARRANVSGATISEVMSGRKNAGVELCRGLARAFGVSPESMLRLTGILPPAPQEYQDEETILALFRELPEAKRGVIIDMMRGAVEANKIAVNAKDE